MLPGRNTDIQRLMQPPEQPESAGYHLLPSPLPSHASIAPTPPRGGHRTSSQHPGDSTCHKNSPDPNGKCPYRHHSSQAHLETVFRFLYNSTHVQIQETRPERTALPLSTQMSLRRQVPGGPFKWQNLHLSPKCEIQGSFTVGWRKEELRLWTGPRQTL